jgi:hypothetical protein
VAAIVWPAAARAARAGSAALRRIAWRGHEQRRRLGWTRLGPDGPPDDADQVQDRQLEDEHQEDDLDHDRILGMTP